jgi:outer membrane receptor for Fe3+-dicitrate
MSVCLDHRCLVMQTALVLVLLGTVVVPVLAEEKQDVTLKKERGARIQELQRQQARVEGELRLLRSQPEGTARFIVPRSELSDQPTRSMKDSLESVPGVSARQSSNGRNL